MAADIVDGKRGDLKLKKPPLVLRRGILVFRETDNAQAAESQELP